MGGKRWLALYVSSQGRHVGFPHFIHGQRPMNMNRYTNVELVDIRFICRLANGNGRAVRLYRERYPTRWQPYHPPFAQVHQNMVELESFRTTIESTG
ncbi:hypothetical protein TNCV_1280701 [Trichonephila clavipes]|nr:hypothetical protein TNCV_1280701 [Trichonephila clavipes]